MVAFNTYFGYQDRIRLCIFFVEKLFLNVLSDCGNLQFKKQLVQAELVLMNGTLEDVSSKHVNINVNPSCPDPGQREKLT